MIQATEPINEVRARMPAKHLSGNIFDLEKHHKSGEMHFPKGFGTSIWLYPGNVTRANLMKQLQDRGHPVIWETDDNYTIPSDTPDLSAWGEWADGTERHSYDIATKAAALADGVIVATPELAKIYGEINQNTHVARNCVDPDDWPKLKRKDDGVLRFGWAASHSHYYDAFLLREAAAWLEGRTDVELVTFGITLEGVRNVPWTDDPKKYRKSLQQIDVMLCPMRRTPFADCRSDLKCLEAAMAGACSVVSDSPAYDLWQDRTHVVKTERGWTKLVKHLAENRHEVDILKQRHRDYVLSERTIQTGVNQWETAIESVERSRSDVPVAAVR